MHIAELLVLSQLITTDQLDRIFKNPEDTLNLPLGKALVFSGYVTTDELNEAMRQLTLLRAGKVELDDAVASLVKLRATTNAAGGAAKPIDVENTANRLGQLLMDAGINNKPADATVEIAETCVKLIDRKILTEEQAASVLDHCCKKSVDLPKALEQLGISRSED
ncbi:MAG TPA: hypothetical protein V6D22_20365 [Candidatus Obscuribacterales bacterium]